MTLQTLLAIQGVNEQKSERYAQYNAAKQTYRNTSPRVPPAMRKPFFTSVPVCRLAIQAFEERISLDTVSAETEAATSYLRGILDYNDRDELISLAHTEAMMAGRAYIVPSANTSTGKPFRLTIVPAHDMVHRVDPITGEMVEGLRVYGKNRDHYVYYTPTKTEYLEPNQEGLTVVDSETVDRIAVFPITCRDTIQDPYGRPETKDGYHLQDALIRIMTDLSVASASMAVPTHAVIGTSIDDFATEYLLNEDGSTQLDADGKPIADPNSVSAAQLYSNELLLLADPAAKLAEFGAAQLQNFTTGSNAIIRSIAAIFGLPVSLFGVASDSNPASGDAQRQDDQRLINRAERLTRGFTPGWKRLFSYLLSLGGFGDEEITLTWVDPGLPSLSARSDSVAKLASIRTSEGVALYDRASLLEKMGESQEVIDRAKTDSRSTAFDRLFSGEVSSDGSENPAPEGQPASDEAP